MAGTLIVWKTPRVVDEDEAARVLGDYYATGDESAFEPSADVAQFYDDLVALYPPLEDVDPDEADVAPTWASTPERSDRIVTMDYRWSVSDAFLAESSVSPERTDSSSTTRKDQSSWTSTTGRWSTCRTSERLSV
jgi:hypothetical protein